MAILVYSVEAPSMLDPSGICCIEGPSVFYIQSAEVPLAVSEGQPLFALSMEYFLFLPTGPSTTIDFFM